MSPRTSSRAPTSARPALPVAALAPTRVPVTIAMKGPASNQALPLDELLGPQVDGEQAVLEGADMAEMNPRATMTPHIA